MLLQESHPSARSDGPRSEFGMDLLAGLITDLRSIEQESGVMAQDVGRMDTAGLRRWHNPLHRRSTRVAAASRVSSPLEHLVQEALAKL